MNKRRRTRVKDTAAPATIVAYRIPAWCAALSISRAQFYILLTRGGIEVVKVGGTMPLIKTSPEDYLAWAAEQERIAAKAASAAPVDSAGAKRGPGRPRRVVHAEPTSAPVPIAARAAE